ncbi:hypothetical protein Q8A67_015378 [Cirrhinus molitorella]|uniref:Uncharacterized protein n=1 Tax=Cirrhinus molitorella TaxID=172907 RepID=A0AA88TK16_9TELE|nr:hypothetical protein Q8A67_015378 [Cirrhinus molitorella]
MFESVRVGRSLLLFRALSSSPSASLWHRPDMTGADLGHRVCLAELCSAAASTCLLATALPSGQGLSLGPTATLTLSGAATLAGHGEWDCRWARLTGRLMWDGFTTGRTVKIIPQWQKGAERWYFERKCSASLPPRNKPVDCSCELLCLHSSRLAVPQCVWEEKKTLRL